MITNMMPKTTVMIVQITSVRVEKMLRNEYPSQSKHQASSVNIVEKIAHRNATVKRKANRAGVPTMAFRRCKLVGFIKRRVIVGLPLPWDWFERFQ